MKYTIEIEENERTLEFQLDVECNYWNIAAHTSGAPEDCCEGDAGFDVVSVDIEWVEIFYVDGKSEIFIGGRDFDALKKKYYTFVANILDEDEKLFEAWKKHTEEV